MKRTEYKIDYSLYTFNPEDEWGDYYKGSYREPCFNKSGYNIKPYKCTDNNFHTFLEHVAKWIYFNGEIPDGLEIDHIIPVKNGGTNKLSNLRLVTRKGNANNEISLENKRKAQIKRWDNPEEIEKQQKRKIEYWKCNPEEAEKMRQLQIKRWENPEERLKYSEMFKGENNPNFGNKWNDEQRNKMSMFNKTDKKAQAHIFEMNMRKRKEVIRMNPNGEIVEFESTRDAARKTNLQQSCIAAACRGKRNHKYKNSFWHYKNEA